MNQWIEGYIHITDDDVVYGNVRLVSDIRFYAGEIIGIMELVDGTDLIVKKHPGGTLNGSIIR